MSERVPEPRIPAAVRGVVGTVPPIPEHGAIETTTRLLATLLLSALAVTAPACRTVAFSSVPPEPTQEITLGFGRDVCPIGCYPVIYDKLWHYPGVYRVDLRPQERRGIVIAREHVEPAALLELVRSEGSVEILSVKYDRRPPRGD